jgi:hypothetical protein|uniref:Galactosyltransferase C-terminal domain-containing protein n=1 Tax=viral metagenome TaxID=1070528 RepID=A0A6C0IN26_9ZZZZ
MIPKIVFIIPYRDRETQKQFFIDKMTEVLEDISSDDYRLLFIHQCDSRDFNRGAMKNIGFLYIKSLYPEDYKNITLVFNDVDTTPTTKNQFQYITQPGVIKHFYGCKLALGGIVSVLARDFEYINGFPNFWTWGYEDNLFQERALLVKYTIDRSCFVSLMEKEINHDFSDGFYRYVNRNDYDLYLQKTSNGIHSISNLSYEFDPETNFVNVTHFDVPNIKSKTEQMDLRITNIPYRSRTSTDMKMSFT